MATYKPIRKTANGTEEIKIPYAVLADPPTIPDISGKLNKTENTGVSVLGTTKSTTTLGGNQLVAPNGIIFAGTAANAGLVTRGICGVTTPDSNGACSKEHLYINYDGNNDFNAGRQVVLNAGAVGNHLGSNMYQYAVPRGDIVKAWVEAQGYAKTTQIPTANNGTLTIQKNGTTVQTFSANQSGNVTANITVPTKVSELTNDSGFTTNTGTITGIKMNGSSKGTSGVVDLGTVITAHQDISGKANLSGGNTFSGLQTVNAPANSSGTEQATAKFKTANGGSITFGKEGANSGTMIRLDQTDGTCRLRFRSSSTAGAMVWEQPEQGANLYVDLGKSGADYHRITFPASAGTLALTSQIPTSSTVSGWGFTKNTGTVTSVAVKMNGAEKGKVTSSGTIDLGTVITADGGTINKSKTVKMDASANSNGANLKWGTVNSKNPYIGYASDQTDGTFVVGSLLGTNYASGLAIGGGSGNLLWKGAKVATTSDIPNISGKLDKTAFSLSGTTLTITI